MQKLFDKILTKKIIDVYSNHTEKFRADDWKKLKAKMNKKKHSVIFYIHIAKAASIAIFITLSTFTANKHSLKKDKLSNIYLTVNTPILNKKSKQSIPLIQKQEFNNQKINRYESKKEKKRKPTVITTKTTITKKQEFNNSKIKKIDSVKILNKKVLPEISNYEDDTEIINKKKNNKFNFSFAITSMYSFEKITKDMNVNMGTELLTSYKLSKNISIVSGLLFSKQTVKYEENILNDANSFSDSNYTSQDSYNQSAKIDYIGMDIPLNFRLNLNKWIISSGVSSYILINEKKIYTNSIEVNQTVFNQNTNTYTTEKIIKSKEYEVKNNKSNNFIFAGSVNLSIGYEFPLQKGALALETFTKYPLKNMSFANIKITTIGMALQYKF